MVFFPSDAPIEEQLALIFLYGFCMGLLFSGAVIYLAVFLNNRK